MQNEKYKKKNRRFNRYAINQQKRLFFLLTRELINFSTLNPHPSTATGTAGLAVATVPSDCMLMR